MPEGYAMDETTQRGTNPVMILQDTLIRSYRIKDLDIVLWVVHFLAVEQHHFG